MQLHDSNDSLLRLADNLHELEVVIGGQARPIVQEVGAGLREAIARRERGDMPGALAKIRRAMERLAALGSELDPAEGAMMREVAQVFMRSLSFGEKDPAKEAVNLMKRKAGGPKDEDRSDW